EAWLAGDAERRAGLGGGEEVKRQRNEASGAMGKVKQQGVDATQEIAAVGQLKERIEQLETRLSTLEEELRAAELTFPNLPHASVPVGKDETANHVERTVGEPTRFSFTPRAHWDLGPALGILEIGRA